MLGSAGAAVRRYERSQRPLPTLGRVGPSRASGWSPLGFWLGQIPHLRGVLLPPPLFPGRGFCPVKSTERLQLPLYSKPTLQPCHFTPRRPARSLCPIRAGMRARSCSKGGGAVVGTASRPWTLY